MKSKFKSILKVSIASATLLFVLNGCSSTKKSTNNKKNQIGDWIIVSDKEITKNDISNLENNIKNYFGTNNNVAPKSLKLKFYWYSNNVNKKIIKLVIYYDDGPENSGVTGGVIKGGG